MKNKLSIVFIFFVLLLVSTSHVLISYAMMNNIDNGILKVEYDRLFDDDSAPYNEKRDQLYNNIVPLSNDQMKEVTKNPVEIDYDDINITDDDFSDCDYFDIQGQIDGTWRSTTFDNLGYFAAIKVNDYVPRLMKYDGYVINTIQCDIETEFVYNGDFVKVEYVLKNVGDAEATISLGGFADIQIGDNDCATVERIGDSEGIRMYDETDNLQFSFYGKNREYVTNIDRLWLGLFPYEETHFFNQNSLDRIEKNDTSFSFSWIDRKIQVGETQRFSVLIGLGKLTSIPVVEFDSEQSDYYKKSDVVVNTIVKDTDENSEAEVFYQVDDAEEPDRMDFKRMEDGKAGFPIDLNAKKLENGKHHIKVWARDNQGNQSTIIEKDFYVITLDKPTIDMNEEWTKDTRKFKVLDDKNIPENVSKYFYRVNEGEWIETQLGKEEIALDETGEAKVEAKAVGTSDDEFAISDIKTARVDKNPPIENHVDIVNRVLTISAKDEHSGIKGYWYDLTDKEEPKENLEDYSIYNEGTVLPEDNSKNDLYLHYISADNVGNMSKNVAFIPYPQKVEIDVNKEFKDETPNFIFSDKQVEGDFPFTYEIQINDGKIKSGNPNTAYDIINPINGKNTIRISKKDVLGRISEVAVAEFNYKEKSKNNETDTEQNQNTNKIDNKENNNNSNNSSNNNSNNNNNNNINKDSNSSNNDSSSSNVPDQNSQSNTNNKNNDNPLIVQKRQDNSKEDTKTATTDGTKTYFVASKDDTIAQKKIPKAGNKGVLILLITAFIITAVGSAIKYKRNLL